MSEKREVEFGGCAWLLLLLATVALFNIGAALGKIANKIDNAASFYLCLEAKRLGADSPTCDKIFGNEEQGK